MLRSELTIPAESWRIPFNDYQSTQESKRGTRRDRTGRSDEANLRPGRVAGGPRRAFQVVVQDGGSERIRIAASAARPGAVVVSESDPKTDLLARYRTGSPRVRELVERVAERFGRNAAAIERPTA